MTVKELENIASREHRMASVQYDTHPTQRGCYVPGGGGGFVNLLPNRAKGKKLSMRCLLQGQAGVSCLCLWFGSGDDGCAPFASVTTLLGREQETNTKKKRLGLKSETK